MTEMNIGTLATIMNTNVTKEEEIVEKGKLSITISLIKRDKKEMKIVFFLTSQASLNSRGRTKIKNIQMSWLLFLLFPPIN